MEQKDMTVTAKSAAEAALSNKSFGVSPAHYYRPEPRFGFTPYAELWHGRLAMVGFFITLALVLFAF